MHEPNDNYEKFLALDEEKRKRIIGAAMKEFLAGYKHASTDNIVREAGISKGLLFHYFGTKERLYLYLITHVIETVQDEFLGLLNIQQPDILDSVWQMSLLKRDLSLKYPVIFDFLTWAYMDVSTQDSPAHEILEHFMQRRNEILAQVYTHTDYTLFRDDIDPAKAVQLISWAMNGFAEATAASVTANPTEGAGVLRENYDRYLEEFREYVHILRRCFYKNEFFNNITI